MRLSHLPRLIDIAIGGYLRRGVELDELLCISKLLVLPNDMSIIERYIAWHHNLEKNPSPYVCELLFVR